MTLFDMKMDSAIAKCFITYINDIYRAYEVCIPFVNSQNKDRHNLIYIFNGTIELHTAIDNLKYMQHFNLKDGVVWLRNEVFKDLNISLSANINLNNLSDYVNGDLINFNICITDIDADYSISLSGKIITYLMNIDKIANEALIEVKPNGFGKISAINTAQKYNAFIYLNNVNGD